MHTHQPLCKHTFLDISRLHALPFATTHTTATPQPASQQHANHAWPIGCCQMGVSRDTSWQQQQYCATTHYCLIKQDTYATLNNQLKTHTRLTTTPYVAARTCPMLQCEPRLPTPAVSRRRGACASCHTSVAATSWWHGTGAALRSPFHSVLSSALLAQHSDQHTTGAPTVSNTKVKFTPQHPTSDASSFKLHKVCPAH